jgi:hypothetical protein
MRAHCWTRTFAITLLLATLAALRAGEAAKTHLMFLDEFKPAAAPADLKLTVRLDFFKPNEDEPDEKYFAPGNDKDKRYPWTDILLVSAKPGAANGSNKKFQIRAKIRGLKALIEKGDPHADIFPVRIYRTFVNEVDDDEAIFTNAYTKLFGAAPKDEAGLVKEPAGRRIDLKRVKEIKGDDAVFVSEAIDVSEDDDLNPARSKLPLPPAVAAFDSDAWYTQMREIIGDEEPDGWAFLQAMKAKGFISAGLAHPYAKKFLPARGGAPYQFSVSLQDALHFRTEEGAENLVDTAVIQRLKELPSRSRAVPEVRDRVKNLGASKVTGRVAANGAFIISTGVQKLVVTALTEPVSGDTSWRFPGIVHTCDGWMDQCLIRAPAPVFYFSGHGWNVQYGGKSFGVINAYAGENVMVMSDKPFLVYATAYLPNNEWGPFAPGNDENRVLLSEKWKKDEVKLQWVYLVGCEALNKGTDPLVKWSSNAGNYGNLIVKELGAKGVLGFADHGFSSVSFMKHYVEKAGSDGVIKAWMGLFDDDESKKYTWYESNERHGQSRQKSYKDFARIVPAFAVRTANLPEKLSPEAVQNPAGAAVSEFQAGKEPAITGEYKDQ